MNKWVMVLAFLLLVCGTAVADESVYQKAKTLVDSIEPSGGVFFNLEDHTIQGYTSGRIISRTIKGYTVDGTLGYAIDHTVVAGFETDLLADTVKLTHSGLLVPWLKVSAGYSVGYSIEDSGLAHGPVLDASVKW